jgi:galactose mutarotase-like enzyme
MSKMYLAMLQDWCALQFHRVWRRGLMRSGMVTGLILAVLVGVLSFAYRERGRGNLHKLEAKIATDRQEAPVSLPGGQEAIKLTRMRLMGGTMPEFLSVTMLPGRGMNVLQVVAYIPGKGEVNLLASPSVEGAESAMTGTGEDADGKASLTMGGAFEVPWAGRIEGVASQVAGGRVSAVWRGHTMTLPGSAEAVAHDGLLLANAADSADTTALPDGGQAQAVFHAGDFRAHWPSKTDVTVTVLLGSQWIELTVVMRNTGDAAEPVGIGWHPRFAIFDGNREQLRLRLPGEMREEVRDRESGLPTGVLLPVNGTPYDFTGRGGAALGKMDLDDSFVALHRDLMDNSSVAELSDPANDYGIRLTALSPTIKAFRVVAPADADYVSIGPQFNYDDPFGREWSKDTDTGMVVLQPGQSTQWEVRLELYSLAGNQNAK